MTRLGRPPRLPRDQEGLFADLWHAPAVRVVAIMDTFRMSEATVYYTARRLHLPDRADIRTAAGLPPRGPLVGTRIASPVIGPAPSGTWMCACGGRSDSPDGHPTCKRRAA